MILVLDLSLLICLSSFVRLSWNIVFCWNQSWMSWLSILLRIASEIEMHGFYWHLVMILQVQFACAIFLNLKSIYLLVCSHLFYFVTSCDKFGKCWIRIDFFLFSSYLGCITVPTDHLRILITTFVHFIKGQRCKIYNRSVISLF